MINDETLIKIVRKRGFQRTWPTQVNRMKSRLEWVRLGFPGIRNDHLSLIKFSDLKLGDLYIYDEYLENDELARKRQVMNMEAEEED